jgi:hypothetical protein
VSERPARLRWHMAYFHMNFTVQSIHRLFSSSSFIHLFLLPLSSYSQLITLPFMSPDIPSLPQVPSSGRLEFMRKYSLHPYSLKLDLATDLWSEVAVLVMARQEIIKVLAALKVRILRLNVSILAGCVVVDRCSTVLCCAVLCLIVPAWLNVSYWRQAGCFKP